MFSFLCNFLKKIFFISQVRLDFKNFFKMSRRNRNVILLCLYIYTTLVFCPYLDDLFNNSLDNDQFFFIYVTIFGFSFNIINSKVTNDFKFLVYPDFLKLKVATINFYLCDFLINFEKFFLFLNYNVLLFLFGVLEKFYWFILSYFVF